MHLLYEGYREQEYLRQVSRAVNTAIGRYWRPQTEIEAVQTYVGFFKDKRYGGLAAIPACKIDEVGVSDTHPTHVLNTFHAGCGCRMSTFIPGAVRVSG